MLGRVRRAAPALRRRLRRARSPRCRAMLEALDERRRRRRRLPRLAEGASVGRPQPLRAPHRGRNFVALCRAVLHEPHAATSSAASSSGGRDGRTRGLRARQLDGWTFDAETLALARAPRLPPPRGRHRRGATARARGSRCRACSCRSCASWSSPAATCAARSPARPPTLAEAASFRLTLRAPPGGARGALAFAPLAGLLLRVATKGGYFTGADGFLVLDQMQYVNWTRQAAPSRPDRQPLRPRARPALVPAPRHPRSSGVLNALGLNAIAAYLVWKPVAIGSRCSRAPRRGSSASCRASGRSGRARARAVLLLTGGGARRLDGLGRARHALRLRLPRRAS